MTYKTQFIAKISLSILFILTIAFVKVSAAPGDLDTTFGTGGKVLTEVTPRDDNPTRIRFQSDGKIVILGYVIDGDFNLTESFISRYNANGTLDTSFGTNGIVVLPLNTSDETLRDFIIQPNGKLIVVGDHYASFPAVFSVFRYNADGTRDTTFGTNGVITTQFPAGSDFASAEHVVLQPDGKIVVVGSTILDSQVDKVALTRYNADGTLDTSFGTNGIIITTVGTNLLNAREILIQTDGKILIAGHANFGGNIDRFVARYNVNGTLDTTFGTGGIVHNNIGNLFHLLGGMVLQPDGKIVIDGFNINDNSIVSASIIRYNTNGTLDAGFGIAGIVTIVNPKLNLPFLGDNLAIQQNGKLLIIGAKDGTFAVSRYNTNGTIDTSFGTNGTVITRLGNNGNFDRLFAVAVQPDGKIVGAGGVNNASFLYNVGLVRYLGDTVNTAKTPFDYDGDGKADVSVFRPSGGNWYLLNSSSGFTAAQFGDTNDKIVPADYDGDGKTDLAVYRNGTWYLNRSTTGFIGFAFGAPDDVPQPSDFDGDGKVDLAVWRPSNGVWYVYNLANGQFTAAQFGASTDKPVASDYDGDGKADYAVFRPSNGTWYLQRSAQGFTGIQFGDAQDKPVPADYDGDGKTDVAVFRPSNGTWYLNRSTAGFTGMQFGISTDLPVSSDYDGDGKADIAVFRSGVWYLQRSTAGFTGVQFGAASDKPTPNAFVP